MLEKVGKSYDFKQEMKPSREELLCIEDQVLTSDIMNFKEMAGFVEGF